MDRQPNAGCTARRETYTALWGAIEERMAQHGWTCTGAGEQVRVPIGHLERREYHSDARRVYASVCVCALARQFDPVPHDAQPTHAELPMGQRAAFLVNALTSGAVAPSNLDAPELDGIGVGMCDVRARWALEAMLHSHFTEHATSSLREARGARTVEAA